MTKSIIKTYYKRFGYLNLALSFLNIFIPQDANIIGRLFGMILINLAYHGIYMYFNSLFDLSKFARESSNFNKTVIPVMLQLFACMGMIISLIVFYFFIEIAFTENQFNKLLMLCIPIAIFLGSYSLLIDAKGED